MSLDSNDDTASLRERVAIGLIKHHHRRRQEAIRLFWRRLLAALLSW
jgi:hypothetical protein